MLLSLAATVALAHAVRAEDWGQSLKGRVVFDGIVPGPKLFDVTGKRCPIEGDKVVLDDLVVDAKTKGVRWCVVYLVDAGGNFAKPIPVHPAAEKVLAKKVLLDQPCCKFEPHVVALHRSQTLVAKNSATVAHNVFIAGGGGCPQTNFSLEPGASKEVDGWKGYRNSIPVSCGSHPWMAATIFAFDHPYFAVTNERGEFEIKNPPAGKFRVVVRHSDGAFIAADPGKEPSGMGMTLEIKKDGVTDVGEVKMKPPSP
jgi:hypothetical protein